jgi:hypothetical protein
VTLKQNLSQLVPLSLSFSLP